MTIVLPILMLIGPMGPTAAQPSNVYLERAYRLLEHASIVDGHNDLAWQIRRRFAGDLSRVDMHDTSKLERPMHTDISRLRKGKVGAQFWSVYVPADLIGPVALKAVLEQIDLVYRMRDAYPEHFEIARDVEEIHRANDRGRIASVIAMEGGDSIDHSLGTLRALHRLRVRSMALTHERTTNWADAAMGEPKHAGLTAFGEVVVREMNRLGMLVDLAHTAPATMHDALTVSEAPVIFSHSACRAVVDNPRNVPDEVLRRLPKEGGVVMVTFVPSDISDEVRRWTEQRDAFEEQLVTEYSSDARQGRDRMAHWRADHPAPRASLRDVADHIDHVRGVAGIDHIGIGSDFDGTSSTPTELGGVDAFPILIAELLRRGYSDKDVRKITRLNILNAMKEAERTAARLNSRRF